MKVRECSLWLGLEFRPSPALGMIAWSFDLRHPLSDRAFCRKIPACLIGGDHDLWALFHTEIPSAGKHIFFVCDGEVPGSVKGKLGNGRHGFLFNI